MNPAEAPQADVVDELVGAVAVLLVHVEPAEAEEQAGVLGHVSAGERRRLPGEVAAEAEATDAALHDEFPARAVAVLRDALRRHPYDRRLTETLAAYSDPRLRALRLQARGLRRPGTTGAENLR